MKGRLVSTSPEAGRAFIVPEPTELDAGIGNYRFACGWWGMVPGQPWSNEPHSHRGLEITHVFEGEGEFLLGRRRFPLERGSVMLAFPGEEHRLGSLAGSSLGVNFISYAVDFVPARTPAGISDHRSHAGLLRSFLGCPERVRVEGAEGGIGGLFGVIRRAMEARLLGWEEVGRAASRALILNVARLFAPAAAPSPSPRSGGEWSWINWATMRREAAHSRAFSYISSHCREDLRVEDVARHIGTSVRNFQRMLLGRHMSFRRILHEWRLTESMFLLIGTDHPIRRIARMVGISNFSYFTATFRREYGMSPRRFRSLREGGHRT